MNIKYVRAHTGNEDFLSKGNEEADFLANIARTSLNNKKIEPFTLDSGGIYLSYQEKVMFGGIKSDLKKIQRELWAKKWKKLNTQGLTMKRNRTSYPQISEGC